MKKQFIRYRLAQKWHNDHLLENGQPDNTVGPGFNIAILLCPAVYQTAEHFLSNGGMSQIFPKRNQESLPPLQAMIDYYNYSRGE
jgi:hypothetical protein